MNEHDYESEVNVLSLIDPSQPRESKDSRDARLRTCKSCEEFRGLTKTCAKCHCFMPMKTWLSNASCPLGKW